MKKHKSKVKAHQMCLSLGLSSDSLSCVIACVSPSAWILLIIEEMRMGMTKSERKSEIRWMNNLYLKANEFIFWGKNFPFSQKIWSSYSSYKSLHTSHGVRGCSTMVKPMLYFFFKENASKLLSNLFFWNIFHFLLDICHFLYT